MPCPPAAGNTGKGRHRAPGRRAWGFDTGWGICGTGLAQITISGDRYPVNDGRAGSPPDGAMAAHDPGPWRAPLSLPVAHATATGVAGVIVRVALGHHHHPARGHLVAGTVGGRVEAYLGALLDVVVAFDDVAAQPRPAAHPHVIHDDALVEFHTRLDHRLAADDAVAHGG